MRERVTPSVLTVTSRSSRFVGNPRITGMASFAGLDLALGLSKNW